MCDVFGFRYSGEDIDMLRNLTERHVTIFRCIFSGYVLTLRSCISNILFILNRYKHIFDYTRPEESMYAPTAWNKCELAKCARHFGSVSYTRNLLTYTRYSAHPSSHKHLYHVALHNWAKTTGNVFNGRAISLPHFPLLLYYDTCWTRPDVLKRWEHF